jgi:hypothetical protein
MDEIEVEGCKIQKISLKKTWKWNYLKGFQSLEVIKYCQIFIFSFSVCSQKYRRMVKDPSFLNLIYIKIWIFIPEYGCHFFLTSSYGW